MIDFLEFVFIHALFPDHAGELHRFDLQMLAVGGVHRKARDVEFFEDAHLRCTMDATRWPRAAGSIAVFSKSANGSFPNFFDSADQPATVLGTVTVSQLRCEILPPCFLAK